MKTTSKVATGSKLGKRFELAPEELTRRMIASLEGGVGTGKTYFGFTAPAPILSQNIDLGAEGVVEQFRKDEGKEIYVKDYEWSPGDPDALADADPDDEDHPDRKELHERAVELRDQWEKDFYYFVGNGGRTGLMDTESKIWQVFRYAEFGAPNADSRKDYDVLNMRYEAMINAAKRNPHFNLFMIRSMKKAWGNVTNAKGKSSVGPTGDHEPWGYEHLPSAMFLELSFHHLESLKTKTQRKMFEAFTEEYGDAVEYAIRFGKCRMNASLQFTAVPRCSYADVGVYLDPDSDISDWE